MPCEPPSITFNCVLDDLRRQPGRIVDRHDLVVIAVQHERRHVDLLEIVRVVDFGELLHAQILAVNAAHHALRPERVDRALRRLGVRAVERRTAPRDPCRTANGSRRRSCGCRRTLHRQAAGVGRRLHHLRRHRADQHGLRHALRTVAADVRATSPPPVEWPTSVASRTSSASSRRPDRPRTCSCRCRATARPAVATTVVRDHAIAVLHEEQHLRVHASAHSGQPCEHDRAAGAPVLK